MVAAGHPMTQLLANPPVHKPGRRAFLWSFASAGVGIGLSSQPLAAKSDKDAETVFRIRTPECEVRMSVEYFSNSEIGSFHFRDSLAERAFCLSSNGEEDRAKGDSKCIARFSGSIAIAHYHFRSRLSAQSPLRLRERVHTIDQDSRMDPRPPFERLLAVERETASDIQAFGYQPDASAAPAPPLALWCLLRQDLFLNEQSAAFLIVHWKHTFNAIHLLDVIPGDRTELIQT
jgi:hypothetical protein